jgi:hypothetical protein
VTVRLIEHRRMTLGQRDAALGFAPGTGTGGWLMRYLMIDGAPAYQLAYSCGTCGLVLRRDPAAAPLPIPLDEVRERLAAGVTSLDDDVVQSFGSRLPADDYLVVLLEEVPRLVTPGSPDDYFSVEQPAAWRDGEWETTTDPANVAYYRLGEAPVTADERLFQFAVPMTEPQRADPPTVGRYTEPAGTPTAVALGVLDISGPWFAPTEHWGLFHFLLDGHHKAVAAARAGRPLRLLSFVSVAGSLGGHQCLDRLPAILADASGRVADGAGHPAAQLDAAQLDDEPAHASGRAGH